MSTTGFINSAIPSNLTSMAASDLEFKEEMEEDKYHRELQRQIEEGETYMWMGDPMQKFGTLHCKKKNTKNTGLILTFSMATNYCSHQ